MIAELITFLQESILPLGAVGVFVASVVEEVIAPIPSALIMTMSGFIFVPPELTFQSLGALVFLVALPAGIGVTVGSLSIFYIVKYGGRMIVERFGKYFGLYLTDIDKLQQKLEESGRESVGLAIVRIIPFIPSIAISAFCGLMNMNVYRYLIVTLIGTFIRGLILGMVGATLGGVYLRYATMISKFESLILYTLVLIVICFLVYGYCRKLKHRRSAQ